MQYLSQGNEHRASVDCGSTISCWNKGWVPFHLHPTLSGRAGSTCPTHLPRSGVEWWGSCSPPECSCPRLLRTRGSTLEAVTTFDYFGAGACGSTRCPLTTGAACGIALRLHPYKQPDLSTAHVVKNKLIIWSHIVNIWPDSEIWDCDWFSSDKFIIEVFVNN